MGSLELVEASGPGLLNAFIRLPYSIYPAESLYVPQLEGELRKELGAETNPFFRHAGARYFLAKRDGSYVGRVASIVNRLHNEFHNDRTGFFGFFECIDEPAVARLLLDAAASELRAAGMDTMRGPMSFSTNEECGLLIEGFDKPPMLMTPYNPPYYIGLLEGFGLRKAKDLYAYIYDVVPEIPDKVLRVAALAERRNVKVRPIRKKDFGAEMRRFREVYNDAWEHNWGFVPLTDEEVEHKGRLMKDIMVPELTYIAERDGEPVGFLGMLPDANQMLKVMNGKLNPITAVRALLRMRKIKDLRLLLLGIKKAYRTRGVDAMLYREAHARVLEKGYRRIEFSWILEENVPMQRIIGLIQARLYKKYRLYDYPL